MSQLLKDTFRRFPRRKSNARYAQEIVKPVNRREARRRGGVQRISGAICEETQGVLKIFVELLVIHSYRWIT
uniref:Uncharacterized protein n=1 Tax=Glossina morsitans morsitans TaxID=37546 RepID=A0A1B0FMR0_GLOMM